MSIALTARGFSPRRSLSSVFSWPVTTLHLVVVDVVPQGAVTVIACFEEA
jgi:hypothetical protein